MLTSRTLSERAGCRAVLKAENLQRTGSFKLRGVLSKLAALGDGVEGVACASAGNHAQALAYGARARGLRCEVWVPQGAPLAKVEAAADAGAVVHRHGELLEDCMELAREAPGLAFVHPYDDPDIVAGQATVGLELLEQVEDLSRVVVPVGGGGLAGGIGAVVKAARPEVEVVGVRPERPGPGTIADGIAVKRPGPVTEPLLDAHVDAWAQVGDDDTAEAMVFLLERAKLVVEGGGAVGVAALLTGRLPPRDGTTAVVLSGGNVDASLLAEVVRHHETEAGRRLVVLTRVSDRPGGLARLLTLVGEAGANLIGVDHVREGVPLHVRETAVQLVLETRGRGHADDLLARIAEAGYDARRL